MARVRKTTAPTQYLGFSLQANRLLWHLLHAEAEDSVSLEVLGDVAVTSPTGNGLVEEVKSRTVKGSNPIADHSVELWKTFRNWVDAVLSGTLDPTKISCVLYTSREFEGAFLLRLAEAQTEEQAVAALDLISDQLLGPSPHFSKRNALASTLLPHIERVFSPVGRDTMRKIVPRFSYKCGSQVPKEEMLAALGTKAVGAEVLNDVLLHLLGWVKERVDTLIANGQPACIAVSDFVLELVAYTRKIDRLHVLASLAPLPNKTSVEEHITTRLYVTQLDLIEAPDEDKLAAISDYLRAETDRINWAAKGLVHTSTFDELEEELIRAWRSYQTRISAAHREKEETDRGRLLFADCCLHRINVQGSEPPAHFARGSFHALADELMIGWHPRYKSLLGPREES